MSGCKTGSQESRGPAPRQGWGRPAQPGRQQPHPFSPKLLFQLLMSQGHRVRTPAPNRPLSLAQPSRDARASPLLLPAPDNPSEPPCPAARESSTGMPRRLQTALGDKDQERLTHVAQRAPAGLSQPRPRPQDRPAPAEGLPAHSSGGQRPTGRHHRSERGMNH